MSEKAQTLLHQYHRSLGENSRKSSRPSRVQSVQSLSQAEEYRRECVKELSAKLARIHESFINEHQIRDLNDSINHLMKERLAWEHHIKSMGGPDYLTYSKRQQNQGSVEVDGTRYFGRARELGDVKEILKAQESEEQKKLEKERTTKDEKSLIKRIEQESHNLSANYYGLFECASSFPDEGDLLVEAGLMEDEESHTKRLRNRYETSVTKKLLKQHLENSDIVGYGVLESLNLENMNTMEDVEKVLVDERKREMEQLFN